MLNKVAEVTTTTRETMNIVIILCEDLVNQGAGINMEELRVSLETMSSGMNVEIVPHLCNNLALLPSIIARLDATHAVLGLCSTEYSQIEIQTQAKKSGLNPFGLEVVPLGTLCARVHPQPQATRKATALLGAAVAKARAYKGSGAENIKLYFLSRDQKMTRRSLFTVPPIGYRPVPSIMEERCVAKTGCHLCEKVCPRQALKAEARHMSLDKMRCEGCGVCLAACPREAIDFPGWSLSQFEAQLGALLDPLALSRESIGILFTCQRVVSKLGELADRGISYSHNWLPVMVPCLGMLTPTWLFQALAHQAKAVALLSCRADCPFGQEQAIGGMVNFCRRLLHQMGQVRDRVRVLNAAKSEALLRELQEPFLINESTHQSESGNSIYLGSTEAAFQAMRCLAGTADSTSEVVLEHPCSPFGIVQLRVEGCTGCLACVEACPTGSLVSEYGADNVSLMYTASLCIGCGMCADVCPETAAQVLRVRKMTDLNTLSRGTVLLHKHQMAICEGCGNPIASHALLQHLEASLGESDKNLHTAINRYCPSCRLTFAWSARPSSIQHGDGM